jgi:hypothetical protein
MTRLDRRSLLLAATFVAAQQPMPEWLAHAFGVSSAQDPASREQQEKLSAWRREQLRVAATTASKLSRPLLVLLVPEDPLLHAVGQWYGAFFSHAPTEAMLDVTLCTLVCASAEEVKAELGTTDATVAPPKHGVAMLLIDLPADPKGAPTKVTRIEPELELSFVPPMPKPDEQAGLGGAQECHRTEQAWREGGVARMAASLRDGMKRHVVDRGQQAATVVATLLEVERKLLQLWLREGSEIPPAQLLHVAPLLQQQVAELPKAERDARQLALSKQLRSALASQCVPGSVWIDAGCRACGMGHVSPLCERLLYFYTQPANPK